MPNDQYLSGTSHMSPRKRKRAYETDSTLSGPLSCLSSDYPCQASSPTSPSSIYSTAQTETKIPTSDPNHTSHQFKFKSSFPISKRFCHTSCPKSSTPHSQSLENPSTTTNQCPNLSSCHICNRRPTTVQDLPAYADCEACGQRTCYICMRTCEGPLAARRRDLNNNLDDEISAGVATQSTLINNTSRGKKRCKDVCGHCCIEVGVEGRVWCLVCYNEDEANEKDSSQGKKKKELHLERVGRVADWLEECGDEGGE